MRFRLLNNIISNIKLFLHIISYIVAIIIWSIIYPILRYKYIKNKELNNKNYFLKQPSIILCLWCLHIDKFYNIKNIKIY